MKLRLKELAVILVFILLLVVVVEAAIVTNITIKGGGTLKNGGIFIVNTTNQSDIASGDVLYADGSLKMVGNVTKLNIVRVGYSTMNVIEGFAVYVNGAITLPYKMEIGPRNNFTLNLDGFNVDTKTQSVSLSISSSTIST